MPSQLSQLDQLTTDGQPRPYPHWLNTPIALWPKRQPSAFLNST